MSILDAIAVFRSRRRGARAWLRDWLDWAEDNPSQAETLVVMAAGLLHHRARVLEGRKRAFRKAHRVRRLHSLAKTLDGLARDLRERGVKHCRLACGCD